MGCCSCWLRIIAPGWCATLWGTNRGNWSRKWSLLIGFCLTFGPWTCWAVARIRARFPRKASGGISALAPICDRRRSFIFRRCCRHAGNAQWLAQGLPVGGDFGRREVVWVQLEGRENCQMLLVVGRESRSTTRGITPCFCGHFPTGQFCHLAPHLVNRGRSVWLACSEIVTHCIFVSQFGKDSLHLPTALENRCRNCPTNGYLWPVLLE
jgi:hypothetical protein